MLFPRRYNHFIKGENIMTKEDVQQIIKRYIYIWKAIKNQRSEVIFYIGKRRKRIVITEEIIAVCSIIEDVRDTTEEAWVKKMINGILRGESDISILFKLPCERSMYYDRKRKFVEQVYKCCVAKQMVPYEELLKEGIA